MCSLKDMCKEARATLGLTRKAFGRLIGATQTEISFIEGGFTPPNEQKVNNIISLYQNSRRDHDERL